MAANKPKKRFIAPPAYPEIATQYQNDPRTKVALTALAAGASTDPVAEGKYGIADGIARVLQGGLGGLAARRQMDAYRKITDAKLASVNAMGKANAEVPDEVPVPPVAGGPPPAGVVPPPTAVQAATLPPVPATVPPPPEPPPELPAEVASLLGSPKPVAPVPGGVATGQTPFPAPAASPVGRGPAASPRGAVNYTEEDADALARMIYTEAGGEGPLGQAAAAHTAVNRLRTGYQNAKSIREVVYAPKQFTGMTTSRAKIAKTDPAYLKARKLAEDVLAGRVADPTKGAINFINHDLQRANGDKPQAWAPEGKGRVIGHHEFYGGEPGDPIDDSAPVAAGEALPAHIRPAPPLPAPIPEPERPAALKAGRSPLLAAAYKLMAEADEYDLTRANKMYEAGLAEQGTLNENAIEREQKLIDAQYGTRSGIYATALGDERRHAYSENEKVGDRTFQHGERVEGNEFTHSERLGSQDFSASEAEKTRKNALDVAKAKGVAEDLTDEERAAVNKAVGEGRLDLKGLTARQMKTVGSALLANPGLDAIKLHSLATISANPMAQQRAMITEALPEVISSVRDAAKKVNFSDIRIVGKMQKWVKGELNDPDLTNYMTQRNDAMLTIAQVMRGTGATDMSTRMEAEAAHPTMSPRAWDAWYNAQLTALIPRVRKQEARGLVDAGTADALVEVQRAARGGKSTTAPAAASGGAKAAVPAMTASAKAAGVTAQMWEDMGAEGRETFP